MHSKITLTMHSWPHFFTLPQRRYYF